MTGTNHHRGLTQHGSLSATELQDLRELLPEIEADVRRWLAAADRIPADPAGEQLAALLRDPAGLDFTVRFVDRVIRPEDHTVAARELSRLAADPPAFLPTALRAALQVGGKAAPLAPRLVVPIARRVLRHLVGHLLIDATDARLGASLARVRRRSQARLNLNLLGEAVLGRGEADRRLAGTLALLTRDDVDYVSIKVSATVAPHQPWAYAETVDRVMDRLRPLYRVAADHPTPKFINLDMEEYRDLPMTLEVFTRLLDEPELRSLAAGIVLQAYLPDALGAMQRLQEWAARRVASGGAPIKVRLVKGANLPMEHMDASLHGWPLATWHTKQDSDTHYKRVLLWALTPERVQNVRLGVAGHNLFDIALARQIATRRGVTEALDVEMLLGMAPGQAEAVRRDVGDLLLYVPVVHPGEFDVAIAYLIRRLEEGASRDNFMSAVFDLATDEGLFARERDRFIASIEGLAVGVPATHRTQDRTAAITIEPTVGFTNTPDSDPAIGVNQAWAAGIRARARSSRLGLETVAAHTVSTREELNTRISTAVAAGAQWGARPAAERAAILHRAGVVLESRRAELMEVAAAEAGKLLDQSDPEVSEAVDFAHFYAERALDLERIDGAVAEPVRLTVVTPPWNFPIAIPTGSTIAALAAGSAVLLKPASPAVRTGACLVEALWEAGVPRDVLQLVKLSERNLGEQLVGDPRVDRVILTGGFETAELFRSFRPDLQLLAETSGKNALIVTPHADYDLAARDVMASAFGHAGQKCSAASLLILVGQAGRSPRLRNQLLDGIRSLVVGYPWDAEAQMGPVITPPDGKLLTGLTSLGAGEHWVLEPRPLDDGGTLWSPGVRWGVQPGSAFHRTEYFGPILGIMHTETLAEAIAIANDVDYGLTAGLHSLDEAEIAHWIATIQAGNLYVNRGITGAIVQRQPFGGWKRSVVGPSAKAGGPNYLLPLVDWRAAPAQEGVAPRHASVRTLLEAARRDLSAAEQAALTRATASDERAWQTEYGITKDVSGLLAERNVVRYCPMPGGVIRLAEDGHVADLVRVAAAALRAGARPDISTGVALPVAVHTALTSIGFVVRSASDTDFASAVQALPDCRIRMVSADPVVGVRRLAEATRSRLGITILGQPVTESGRVEMLGFLREQAIAVTAHRFGTPHPTPLDSPDTYGGSHDNAP